eukprot:GHVS01075496.1.p1 GENE.GHVS01075496.1~~GHVS01075496.1.p1  ORF type:complete len:223 (-),score=34.47 GHVS01075496.1:268-936(-)
MALQLQHKMNLGSELRESVKRLRWQQSDNTGHILVPIIAATVPIGFVVVISVGAHHQRTPKSTHSVIDDVVPVMWTLLELCPWMRNNVDVDNEEEGRGGGTAGGGLSVRTADIHRYVNIVNGLQNQLAQLFEDIATILHQEWIYAPTGSTHLDAPVDMPYLVDWPDVPVFLLYLIESFYTGIRLTVTPSCLYCLRFALAHSLLHLILSPSLLLFIQPTEGTT